jgi:hypothetical protein
LFPAQRFGVPDFDSGLRASRRSSTLDYPALAKQFAAPPAQPAAEAAAPAEVAAAIHGPQVEAGQTGAVQVDIRPREHVAGRDLKVEAPGELVLVSDRPEVSILVEGKPVARELPYSARLAAGTYDIRVLSGTEVLVERQVVVQAGKKIELSIK